MIDLGEIRRGADGPAGLADGGQRAALSGAGRLSGTGRLSGAGRDGGPAVRVGPRPRLGAALATLASAAALLTGAAGPDRPPLTETRLAAALGDAFRVIGDQVYLSRPDLSVQRRPPRMIADYRLPEGTLLWRAPLAVRGVLRKAVTLSSATLVSMEGLDGVETVAIEWSTSRIRWRGPYLLVDVAPERDLALVVGTAPGAGPDPGRSTLAALDAATGRLKWEHRVPDGAWHHLDQQRLVSALPSGRVEIRELAHGTVVAAADLREPAPPSIQSWAQPAEGLLLVATGHSTVVAYGLPHLDRRWRADWDLTDWSVAPDCGEALCVFTRMDGLRMVDRATGQTRWSDPQWISAEPAGGRLLVRGRQRPGGGSAAALVDRATGRELLDLRRWTAVGRAGTGGGALLATQIDRQDGRAWFGSVDPTNLTVQVVDSATGVGTACQPGPDSLVCRRRDLSISVWRLNRRP